MICWYFWKIPKMTLKIALFCFWGNLLALLKTIFFACGANFWRSKRFMFSFFITVDLRVLKMWYVSTTTWPRTPWYYLIRRVYVMRRWVMDYFVRAIVFCWTFTKFGSISKFPNQGELDDNYLRTLLGLKTKSNLRTIRCTMAFSRTKKL